MSFLGQALSMKNPILGFKCEDANHKKQDKYNFSAGKFPDLGLNQVIVIVVSYTNNSEKAIVIKN